MPDKLTRERRKASGLCINCGKLARPDRVLCQRCADTLGKAYKKHHQKIKAAGLCAGCRSPLGKGSTETLCCLCADKMRMASRAHYKRNKEARTAQITAYRNANRDKTREWDRIWGQGHPDAIREKNRKRRARQIGAFGHHTIEQLQARIDYYGGLCYLCGKPYECIDHVIPLFRGGTDWPANLRPACKSCNSSKGTKALRNYMK